MELTKHGNNANIKINILPEDTMRENNFTDYRKGYWYLYAPLGDDISFNLSINKEDPTDWVIDVLDENFLQPYDYQYILETNEHHHFAQEIKNKVEIIMGWLIEIGIVKGWSQGDYI